MVEMRTLLHISPKLLDNFISMIASRTTVKTYGIHFHKAMSAIPVKFWASVQHLHLISMYPNSVEGMFIYSPKLQHVEFDLEWLTVGSPRVEVVTTETFDRATEDDSQATIKAKINEIVVGKTREYACTQRE